MLVDIHEMLLYKEHKMETHLMKMIKSPRGDAPLRLNFRY